jgi:hypothetical protein
MDKFIAILLAFVFIISCEKSDTLIRKPYLIVGEKTDCLFVDFKPDIALNPVADSFDIDFDNQYDIFFKLDSVFVQLCTLPYDSCPNCDCWPSIFTVHTIKLLENTQIAIYLGSVIDEFEINDTLSKATIWSSNSQNTNYQLEVINFSLDMPHELFLGLRKIKGQDTLYSWLNIEIENDDYSIKIKELAIQK